jgi:hypothetical protein
MYIGMRHIHFAETGRGGNSNLATPGGTPFASLLLRGADNRQT